MRNSHFTFFLATALLLTACSSDDDSVQEPADATLLPLTIEVAENPYVNPDEAGSRETRAAIATTSSLTAFQLNYNYVYGGTPSTSDTDIAVTTDGNHKWVASSGSWPVGGTTVVNWYAKSVGDFIYFNYKENDPYIDFTMVEDASNLVDLLVATATGSYSDTGGKLSFTFDHACTALRFYVKKATNLNDYTLTVSLIKLCNVKKEGKYHYNTSSWSSVETNANFSLYSGSDKTLGSSEYEALDTENGPYLFVIPQTLTAWDTTTDIASTSGTYFELNCTLTRSDSQQVFSGTAYIPFSATLNAGYQHDVKINIGKNSLYSSPNQKVIP